MQTITVQHCWESKGPVFLSEILDWCLKEHHVDMLLVTARSGMDVKGKRSFNPSVDRAARSIFGENLVKRFDARGWPGTKLIGHTGRVYVVRFDETIKKRMIETENALFKWTDHPPKRLPEDICVFRSGSNRPVLVSITHEEEAYIISGKKSRPPGFIKSDFSITELMLVWDGRYFCRT